MTKRRTSCTEETGHRGKNADAVLRALPFVFREIARAARKYGNPFIEKHVRDVSPFHTLIACLLSLRTKDETTAEAATRLFELAGTPEAILRIPQAELSRIIYPVGFYRNKARTLHQVCEMLLERWGGAVPDNLEDLLSLPGVGLKTANLVLSAGFGKPAICVDTHVHRITNRWGLVKTVNPHQTEAELRRLLPARYWNCINHLLVVYGRNVCTPVSPKCSMCSLDEVCAREDVGRSR